MASKKANPYAKRLAQLAKTIAKVKPAKLHAPLFEVFVVVAAAGDAKRAARVLDWMYGRTPTPTAVATALSTGAIDVFCAAAKLGDRTHGAPGTVKGTLAERVKTIEATVRARVTMDGYGGKPPKDDAWQKKKEPWRTNDRWRRIQGLVVAGKEADALERIGGYLADLGADARGGGYGDELALALDLALRARPRDVGALTAGWITQHGHRFESESFLLETALSFPAIAGAVLDGLLRDCIGLSEADLDGALAAIDDAIETSTTSAAAAAKAPPKVQKRRVGAEYAQVHLEPSEPSAAEREIVHFQKATDSARGMSLFATSVGIATPSDTDYVDAEITIAEGKAPALKGIVQAVAFPLTVRGPLVLRSATSDDDEPFVVPPGAYDVVARFLPKKAPRASSEANLRVFTLALSFHPAKSLGAPKTLRMESAP